MFITIILPGGSDFSHLFWQELFSLDVPASILLVESVSMLQYPICYLHHFPHRHTHTERPVTHRQDLSRWARTFAHALRWVDLALETSGEWHEESELLHQVTTSKLTLLWWYVTCLFPVPSKWSVQLNFTHHKSGVTTDRDLPPRIFVGLMSCMKMHFLNFLFQECFVFGSADLMRCSTSY